MRGNAMKFSPIVLYLVFMITADAQAHTADIDVARHAFEHSWLAWLMMPLIASIVTLLLRR